MTGAATDDGARAPIILVVEDDVVVRMLACDILAEGGLRSIEAGNAAEALLLLQVRPDIALMFTDVDMPGELNGLGLARLVASRHPALPMLITTGGAGLATIDLPAKARFLNKPYSPSALLDQIADCGVVEQPGRDVKTLTTEGA